MGENLRYLIHHIFFPPKLPQSDDFTPNNEHHICEAVFSAAQGYREYLAPDERLLWDPVVKMLDNLCTLYKHEGSLTEDNLVNCFANMNDGDVTALLIRSQNAGVIVRKHQDRTVFELFEVSAPNEKVMSTTGKLVSSYPGPAIAVPSPSATSTEFIAAVADFLVQMHSIVIKAAMPTTKKAGSEVEETRDTPSPRFITELLTGILRGIGYPEDVERITKRIADDVLWDSTLLPWRRSPMWLVIRVALQTTLNDTIGSYKPFLAFLMSRILEDAHKAHLDSDILATMSKKLARRLYKIRETAPEFVQSEVLAVVDRTQGLLRERWEEVQKAYASDGLEGWDPSSLDIPGDTKLSLRKSGAYIDDVLNGTHARRSASTFEPNEEERLKVLDEYNAGDIKRQIEKLGMLALLDFERAVETGIDDWVSGRQHSELESACTMISGWMEEYSTGAGQLYKGHPQLKSTMFLTLLELWVGLDKLAAREHPLLLEYPPEIQERVFEDLLLPSIICANDYEGVNSGLPSIFSATISSNSFAVRFFEQHPSLKSLKVRIEEEANRDREQKIEDLRAENRRYEELVSKAASLSHDMWFNRWRGHETHDRYCRKCALDRESSSMNIGVHEWPLPNDTNEAKATVFEISCPSIFGLWRQFTYFLLRDICCPPSSRNGLASPKSEVILSAYPALLSFQDATRFRRLTFASSTKFWAKSHYSDVRIPSTRDDVCRRNALRLALFDSMDKVWVSDPFRGCTIRGECTYQLPAGRYRNLQFSIDATSHTSNQVNASQSDCHQDLGLHEYIAFGTLRAGGRIQWPNILRELRARTLTFSEEAVEMLVSQAALQMGPLSEEGRWEWHNFLYDDAFHLDLLAELEVLQTSIQANWSEVGAMRIIILLTHRVLGWCCNSDVIQRALVLLGKSRDATFQWMKDFERKLQNASGDDISSHPTSAVGDGSSCSENNIPAKSDLTRALKDPTSWIIVHDHHCSHALEELLAETLAQNSDLLHDAISQSWPTYRSESSWRRCASPNEQWLHSTSADGQQIFFSVLESQLLVDGKPLSRLPSTYVSHPIYSRIFGKTIFNVVPPGNSEPSAEFATKDFFNGYQIFFALSSPDTLVLVIQAKADKTHEKFQLIPHILLEGDLPIIMVEDFTHWLSLRTGVIELRPCTDIWTPSSAKWRIDFVQPRMVASRLACLEQNPGFIIITHSSIPGETHVELPRYRLRFQLNSQGELECLTLPHMIVDSNQSAGIMIGLQTRLVLRGMAGCHTRVSISPIATGPDRRVQYFRYSLDETLGRLVGTSPSLHARLYKIYLTALTSFLLPDPLTGRMGIEEALKELRSSACKSFISLDEKSHNLLHAIAGITPQREYYPPHLRAMQTVRWSALPTLAQHNDLYFACQSILDFAVQLRVFSDAHGRKDESIRTLDLGSAATLVDRAAGRSRWYYLHEFHENSKRVSDTAYQSRDLPDSLGESITFSTSKLITSWPSKLDTTKALLSDLEELARGEIGGLTHRSNMMLYTRFLINSSLSDNWLSLFDTLRDDATNPSQVTFILCTLLYAHGHSAEVQRLIPTLLSFATCREKFSNSRHNPPTWKSYQLFEGFEPDSHCLQETANSCAQAFRFEDEWGISRHWNESDSALYSRRKERYDDHRAGEVQRVADAVLCQWPTPEPNLSQVYGLSIVNSADFIDKAKLMFTHWFHNHELKLHLLDVQCALDVIRGHHEFITIPPEEKAYSFTPPLYPSTRPPSSVSLQNIMQQPAPIIRRLYEFVPPFNPTSTRTEAMSDLFQLDGLIAELENGNDLVRLSYAAEIRQSFKALQYSNRSGLTTLDQYHEACDDHLASSLQAIRNHLGGFAQGNGAGSQVMERAGLWPCLYLRPLLESLASSNIFKPTGQWMQVIRDLTRSLLLAQRAQRMLRCYLLENFDDLNKELSVDASVLKTDDCDWLLIQADSDFLARKVQLSVAHEMITSEKNVVLQLNMGEGKSSVIVPFLGTALANGHQLMRVVVLKSLARQMFSLLVQRLGGLTNRQILFLPFSRDVNVDDSKVQQMRQLYEHAIQTGAILVAQPEHILSLKLMAVDQLIEQERSASRLVQTQQWLNTVTRDVLDESDEILHTRYQLIYTVGQQQILEHGSNRWSTIQQILSLVVKSAYNIRRSSPSGVDVVTSGNEFPHIRILQSDAGERLITQVVEMVMSGELSTCYLERFTDSTRQVLQRFIIGEQLTVEEKTALDQHCGDGTLWKTLLLLRGLLGQRILLYILQERRWRVDYGLHLSRSLLAVPYRAKDVPSLRAEFGHPDVAILLTCLSYLYGGLSPTNIDTCFDILLKLDNPRLEYEEWVRNAGNIPEGLRDLSGVNLTDAEQRERVLFPHFRMNTATINFYLSRVVFPKAAKEFPEKLATTGWDIAHKKRNVTTGFSGTNDNRYLLPTSIIQLDTPERSDTNARMLNLLLAPENNRYLAPSHQALSGQRTVDNLRGLDIRVLLDVGAQIIEMTNAEVVSYWLSQRPDASAAVFFNERDELEVMTQDKTTELLSLSPFHGHLDECLIYLDDAHTRGTDLKLPTHWKACVTLGPKVTKDRLAQGCMRMRKLGRGQSVMFMAPPEIDVAIRKHAHKTSGEEVDSRDVVRWAMLETCAEIKHHIPHWVQQGVDFKSRNEGWQEIAGIEDPSRASDIVRKSWLQPEARTLEDMYGMSSPESAEHQNLTKRAQEIPDIWSRCETLGITSLGDPRVEEEQEREVSHEFEREPQIQRPPKAQPADHTLHPEVEKFVVSGKISRYMPVDVAFVPLRDGAGAGNLRKWDPVPLRTSSPLSDLPQLLATKDFLTTINSTANVQVGDYLRPLNWVVSSRRTQSLVIFSPHEVNELLPKILQSENVTLHIYTPRLTQFMKPTDDLQLYPIPLRVNTIPPSPLMVTQLNLCAGQLYFSNHEEYRRITGFLGICTREDRDCQAENDGFVRPENRGSSRLSLECQFDKSPLSYLKLLVGSRRKGITYDPTHLGKTLNTRYLVNDDF
ncbi:hypothetical protein AAF712_014383 [Marasmius tenuissimus]|uniref:ubiquitinyl hydrolase 1 n=1 Tax=Marasmius tenuissimus TaxID=585030 RepID=A0ABR2ZBF8_9AGAR